jgi:hypothetical protein
MRTMSAFLLALTLASGAAMAQGTESTPEGTNTGREIGSKPTPEECAQGWTANSRWTYAEFAATCREL